MAENLGTLAVVVLKARNLPNKSLWKQDPYCIVRFEGGGQRTKIDERGGQHPVWDDEFRFQVADTGEQKRLLKLSVFTKEHKIDDLIGEAELDVASTLSKGEFDDWVKLTRNGRDVGQVYLEMTFYSAAPPLARRPSKLNPSDRLWRPPQTPPKTPSPAHSSQNLPVPGQAPIGRPGSDLPPAPYQRPPAKSGGLPPSPYERPPPAAKAPAAPSADSIPAALRPHAAPPTSPPKPVAKPLPSEPPGGHIPYRPPPSVDDFLTAPTAPARPPQHATGPALQPVPSILRPGHVRQSPSGGAATGAPARSEAKTPFSKAAQEAEDARLAAELARADGIDVDRLRAEEADAELARRLAAEDGDPSVPGAYN